MREMKLADRLLNNVLEKYDSKIHALLHLDEQKDFYENKALRLTSLGGNAKSMTTSGWWGVAKAYGDAIFAINYMIEMDYELSQDK